MSGVTILHPLALAWLLLLPVLVLLHFRRRARTRLQVSNLFLWRAAQQHVRSSPSLQRLRPNAELLMQLAVVTAAATALAGPVLSCGGGQRVVLILDRSASMNAREAGATRFEDARRQAIETLDGLAGGAVVAVVGAGASPALVQPATTDRARARSAIQRLQTERGAADLEAALALASTAASPAPDEIVLFTDVSASLPASVRPERVSVVRAGAPAPNVAVTGLRVRAHPASGFDGEAFAAITNFGPSATNVPVTLRQRGSILRQDTLSLAPGERRTLIVAVTDTLAPVTATLDVADALAADNEATAAAGAPVRVRLLAANEPYVEAALASNPRVQLVPAGSPEAADVAVCSDCSPSNRSESLLILRSVRGGPAPLTVVDQEHPVTAFAHFDDVVVAVREVPAPRGARVLMRAGAAPVVTASELDGRRILDAGIDFRDSGAPLAVSFPIFVANAIEWLSGDPAPASNVIPEVESNLMAVPAERDAPPAAGEPAGADGTQPLWRVFLIVALGLAAALYGLVRRDSAARGARWAVLALLALSAVDYQLALGGERRHIVFAIDQSASVPAPARDAILQRMAAFRERADPGDELSIVAFGARALVEARRTRAVPGRLTSTPDPAGTNLAGALQAARSLAGPGGSVVLISDGNETQGNARAEAQELRAAQVRLDVLPVGEPGGVRPEVLVAGVTAPPDARAREPFDVVVDVRATAPQRAHVRLLRDGVVRTAETLALTRGTQRLRLADSSDSPGVLQYEVVVEAEHDAVPENNRAGATVAVRGPAQVLYVSPAPDRAGAALLRAQGIDVTVIPPPALPSRSAALDGTDAVVLDEVEAERVTAAQREALAEYVERRAGGLLVTGSGAAFGPGGWAGSRIEEILPVTMRPPARRDAADAALVLVLDKSGSMAELEQGSRKIDIAVQAAVPLVDLFGVSQTLGIIAFDTVPVGLVRPGESADTRRMVERMRALTAGGGTTITPAVELARDWLRATGAKRRHVVLLSDGRSAPADLAALRSLAAAGEMTISTVGVGDGVDRAFLEGLAELSGGRAYFPESLTRLSEIFLQEATLASSAWEIRERFTPRAVATHPVLRGIDASRLGDVAGYVATTARSAASPLLSTHRRDPLLAVWQRGLGRTGVFTTSLDTAWGGDLRGSAEFARAWTQTVRWVSRPRGTGRLHPDVVVRGTTLALGVDAFTAANGFVNLLDVRAALDAGHGPPREVPLRQTGPGRYDAPPIDLEPGFHTIRIDAGEDAALVGVNVSAAGEYTADGPNLPLLADLARITGGRVLGPEDSPFDRASTVARTLDTRQILTGLALLLFVAEVAATRGLLGWMHLLPKRRAVHAE